MTIWKKFKALLAGIELDRKVPRHPAHLWYALLTFLSISAALVMHGHVHFFLAVILLLIPLSFLVYVPYRRCNILSRMLLNGCIFIAGCFWITIRLKHDIPTDKMMVETLSLWSLTFLTAGKSKGYFYLLFIDILLLLYGALLPRVLSLYLTIGAFFVLLIILFRNRIGFLSGDMLLLPPPRSFRRTWHFFLPSTSSLLIACMLKMTAEKLYSAAKNVLYSISMVQFSILKKISVHGILKRPD